MKPTIFIISDFRENFPSVNPSEMRYFNDHPTEESIKSMRDLINSIGYECQIFGGVDDLIKACDNKTELPEGIYLNMSDGKTQEYNRVQVPILCDLLGVNYSGGNPFQVALICNKHYSKLFVNELGFLTPKGILLNKYYPLEYKDTTPLTYPLIIKPNTDGSSVGLSQKNICYNFKELEGAYYSLKHHYNELVVEEFIPGYELTNMYIGDYKNTILNEIMFTRKGETIFFDKDILTLEDKSMKKTSDVLATEVIDSKTISMIKNETKKIVKELHIKDICRIDYRLTKNNQLYILEINSVPRLSITTNTVKMAELNNMTFEELIKKYLDYLTKTFQS